MQKQQIEIEAQVPENYFLNFLTVAIDCKSKKKCCKKYKKGKACKKCPLSHA
jgi:hypothetical protein